MKRVVLLMLAILAFGACMAQKMPERGLVRKGNRQFGRENYERSVDSYTRALQADSTCFEAAYDLGSALFRSERYEKAEQTLQRAVRDTLRSDKDRSEAYFNLGNAQFAQKKLKEALASYREAMRYDPTDKEAKWNYAYTKKLLQDQQNQDQNDKNQDQNKDQNQDDKKDQNQNQNKDQNQDQNKDNSQDQQNQDQNDRNQDQDQGEQPKDGMSDREQQAMLDAIQAQEDKTQDKLKEKKGVLIRGAKNW